MCFPYIPISQNIPLNALEIVMALNEHQGAPWNSGKRDHTPGFEILNKLFLYINSGIPKEYFCYEGSLFRIHTQHSSMIQCIDQRKEKVIGNPGRDGTCHVLAVTEYNSSLSSFSKSPDFTRPVFREVDSTKQAVMFHTETKRLYGIDVNAIMQRYGGYNPLLLEEKEVLFPLLKDRTREYHCTPNQFRYYMRKEECACHVLNR